MKHYFLMGSLVILYAHSFAMELPQVPSGARPQEYYLLHEAVATGSFESIKFHVDTIIRERKTIDIVDTNGITPFLAAVMANKSTAAELLLINGANINATNSFGQDALFIAAGKGNVELVDLLLKKKITKKTQDQNGETALYAHSQFQKSADAQPEEIFWYCYNQAACVQQILRYYKAEHDTAENINTHLNLLNMKNKNDLTAWQVAQKCKNWAVLATFVEYGAAVTLSAKQARGILSSKNFILQKLNKLNRELKAKMQRLNERTYYY